MVWLWLIILESLIRKVGLIENCSALAHDCSCTSSDECKRVYLLYLKIVKIFLCKYKGEIKPLITCLNSDSFVAQQCQLLIDLSATTTESPETDFVIRATANVKFLWNKNNCLPYQLLSYQFCSTVSRQRLRPGRLHQSDWIDNRLPPALGQIAFSASHIFCQNGFEPALGRSRKDTVGAVFPLFCFDCNFCCHSYIVFVIRGNTLSTMLELSTGLNGSFTLFAKS